MTRADKEVEHMIECYKTGILNARTLNELVSKIIEKLGPISPSIAARVMRITGGEHVAD